MYRCSVFPSCLRQAATGCRNVPTQSMSKSNHHYGPLPTRSIQRPATYTSSTTYSPSVWSVVLFILSGTAKFSETLRPLRALADVIVSRISIPCPTSATSTVVQMLTRKRAWDMGTCAKASTHAMHVVREHGGRVCRSVLQMPRCYGW
jgi:hypothetical protein